LTSKPATPYYVRGLALGIPAILLGIQISGWIGILPAITHRHSDFRQLYTAAYMIRSGHRHEIYDYAKQKAFQDTLASPEQIALPFLRPAYQALLFVPLSYLPYPRAFLTFLAVNVALLAISYRLLRPYLDNLADVFPWLPVAMFVTFLPVAAAFMQGQDSVELLALITAAAVSLGRRRDLTAGLLLGLGLFKFQIVIPIAVLFLLWRRWRFSLGFCISTMATAGLSLWVAGVPQLETFARSLISISSTQGPLPLSYRSYAPSMANLHGLIFSLANAYIPVFWVQAMTVTLSLMVLLWVWTEVPKETDGIDLLSIATAAGVFLSYYLFMHDMSVLLVPIVLSLNHFIVAESNGDRYGRLIARAAVLMFVAPICMAFLSSKFYLVSLPLLTFLCAVTFSARLGASGSAILDTQVAKPIVS
jgi:hypothetical protein